jgi:thioredoxin 1
MKVMYFTANWCAPCKALKPLAQQVSSETGVPVQFIDVDEQIDYVKNMNITSVPTLIGIEGGQTIFRHTGMISKGELKSLFQK